MILLDLAINVLMHVGDSPYVTAEQHRVLYDAAKLLHGLYDTLGVIQFIPLG